jgi:pyruvate/2-oxoglutarate dehydrogenase complex dihydrolipoamide acyltransferase (E2) component
MAEAILMPALGETSDELHIIEWLVAEGESVALGQPLLLVETDKAEMEVESVAEGTLLKIIIQEGRDVEASTVIAYVGAPGDEIPASE